MSLKEAYTLAHTAKCKLYMSADRPDRNLRFLVGHAMHLDSLMLHIIEIEESIEQPEHASEVSFKGASGGSKSYSQPPSAMRRSPPPLGFKEDSDSEGSEEGADDGNEDEIEDEDDDLGLTRFPSAAALPPRDTAAPPLDPSEDDSSSDDEDYNIDPEYLKDIVSKSDGDETLMGLYHDVQKCPCHSSDAPKVGRVWEVPGAEKGREGVRVAVAELQS
jgi:hypothetical protein